MFNGGNNPLERGYILSTTPSPGYSYPPPQMGYVGGQQPPVSYHTAPAILSPIYYLPSLSPPLQQQSFNLGTSTITNNYNNLASNLPTSNDTRTSSPNSIPGIEGNPTTTTPLPTKENDFINSNKTSIDVDKKVQPPIDETSSTLLLTDRFAVKLEPNKYIHGIPATKWYTLSDQEREEVLRNQRRITSYKTALCVTFRVKGTCSFGDNCRFAHSLEELKPPPVRHPKYKTQLCDKFSVTGICPYGSRCNFIHATKNGEIVSDYRGYLASKENNGHNYCDEDSDSDDENGRSFAFSMNSLPKKYHPIRKENIEFNNCSKILNDNNKPQQVINFSKSFGAPVIRTLFEKGRLLHDNQNIRKDNDVLEKHTINNCYDNTKNGIENLPKAPSPPYNNSCSINEIEKKKDNDIGNDILKRLFAECNNYEKNKNIDEKKIEEEANEVNNPSGSHSYNSSFWKKHSFYSKNTGFYSQSKLPTFLKFNNG